MSEGVWMDMKVKAIAPWFGGKRTMAPEIVTELGKHTQYFEPFCGSMAVLFQKPTCSQETVNDLHGDVTNLAWVLQDETMAVELYERASRTLFAEDMIRSMWRELTSRGPCGLTPDPERAFHFFAFSWAMRNGVSGTSRENGFSLAIRFTAGGGSPTVRFRSAVESIPSWHDRLRNVVILRRDAFSLIEKFDDSTSLAIYADPPYVRESRSGYAAAGATSRYEHEFDHDNPLFGDDHVRLRDALARFKSARIVVSYYDCARVRKLYSGWTFVTHTCHKNLHVQSKRESTRNEAPEVLIINGPSYAGGCQ